MQGCQLYQEFEEARTHLQNELSKGVSLADLRMKLQSGSTQRKVDPRQVIVNSKTPLPHVQHKRRDLSQLLNKFPTETKAPVIPKKSSILDLGAHIMDGLDGGAVVQKNIFKVGDKELLVLIANCGDEVVSRLVTDIGDPVILHWGLSKNSAGEWLAPPLNVMPKGSKQVDGACETPFKMGFIGNASLEYLDIKIREGNFIGMPFVLWSDGHWIKNNGSDFYISLKAADRKTVKVAAGNVKGTVKWLLDAIAERERDAERSLMHSKKKTTTETVFSNPREKDCFLIAKEALEGIEKATHKKWEEVQWLVEKAKNLQVEKTKTRH
eukprot:Gb_00439 [translate_table: standard]